MKKKFKWKKKVLGISLAALLVGLPFTTNKVENVKADNCVDHTSYYLFADVSYIYSDSSQNNNPGERETSSWFSADIPEGAKLDSASDLEVDWMDLSSGEDGWTYQKFYDTYNSWEGLALKKDGNTWYYFHDYAWASAVGGVVNSTHDMRGFSPDHMYYVPIDPDNRHKLTYTRLKGDFNDGHLELGVKRSYTNVWNQFTSTAHDTNVFAPAVLKASYKVCSGGTPEPSSDKVNLTIHHYLEGTTTEVSSDVRKQFDPNSDYNETCKNVSGYTKVTSSVSGTIGTTDKEEICYYKQSSTPTPSVDQVTLTINYLDKKGNVLKNRVTKTYNKGETVSTGCDDKVKSGNTMYIYDSYTLNGSGKSSDLNNLTMNNDIVLNCIYTSESAGTADLPIFIVWAVGGGALAYSIYFFRKYYKEQNEV